MYGAIKHVVQFSLKKTYQYKRLQKESRIIIILLICIVSVIHIKLTNLKIILKPWTFFNI